MRILFAVPLTLAIGCASTPTQPELLSSRVPPAAQFCRTSWVPDPLPASSAVIDSAGFTTTARRELGSVSGYVLISLAADSTGKWTRIRTIETDLPNATQEKLIPLVGQHLRAAESRRLMRLRIDLGESHQFALGATQSCRPALRNATEIENQLKAAAAELSATGTVILQVHTAESGQAGEVVISRSSGVRAVDEAAARIGRRMVFYPALNDGVPVAVWAEIPLVFILP
jgi:TonB family protein